MADSSNQKVILRSEFVMKRLNILKKVFGWAIVLILMILLIGWVPFEIRYWLWTNQDERRLDFAAYDDTEELRNDILNKLPLGSSEEEVQSFIRANGHSYTEPEKQFQYENTFGIVITESRAGRGIFALEAMYVGGWVIFFQLSPKDHKLMNLSVRWLPGP
jgi:hypothetical protein